jgi:hypothetical protein
VCGVAEGEFDGVERDGGGFEGGAETVVVAAQGTEAGRVEEAGDGGDVRRGWEEGVGWMGSMGCRGSWRDGCQRESVEDEQGHGSG